MSWLLSACHLQCPSGMQLLITRTYFHHQQHIIINACSARRQYFVSDSHNLLHKITRTIWKVFRTPATDCISQVFCFIYKQNHFFKFFFRPIKVNIIINNKLTVWPASWFFFLMTKPTVATRWERNWRRVSEASGWIGRKWASLRRVD